MLLSKHRAQDIPVQKKIRGVVRHILKNRQVICSASLPVYLDTAETEIGAFSGLARCAAIPGSGCPPLLMRTLREEYLGRGDGIDRRVARAAAACRRRFFLLHCWACSSHLGS